MSFHGGLLGVIAPCCGSPIHASVPGCRWRILWRLVFLPGPAAGRVGNFINGELWGQFCQPRSALGHGLCTQRFFCSHGIPRRFTSFCWKDCCCSFLLWLYARRERPQGQVAAAFLVGYGVLRFIAEYFREPDSFF